MNAACSRPAHSCWYPHIEQDQANAEPTAHHSEVMPKADQQLAPTHRVNYPQESFESLLLMVVDPLRCRSLGVTTFDDLLWVGQAANALPGQSE